MAEGTYESECMRAELLGIQKPDYEEFMKNKQGSACATLSEEDVEIENLKEVENEGEKLKHISGRFEELNSILQSTQRKITKFKASCGSLTNLLKFKIGHGGSSGDSLEVATTSNNEEVSSEVPSNVASSSPKTSNNGHEDGALKSDLTKALDNHVDRLDAMIEKAENANYRMAHQNKEMKKFLN